MRIYDFSNYKEYLADYIESLPKRGRGQFLKLSKALNVHPSLISQVLSGPKDFSQEQGYRVCEYLGLNDSETHYFMTMLHLEKAGSQELKDFYKRQLKEQKAEGRQVSSQIHSGQALSEQEASLFYSQWKYSAIRLLTSLPQINTRQDIARYLALPIREVSTIVNYLVSVGLCHEKEGKLTLGTTVTYLDRESPYFLNHQTNWRLRALDQSSLQRKDDLFVTAPMTVSHADFERIRGKFLEIIRDLSEIVAESPSEDLYCLNIDCFQLTSPELL